MSTKPGQLHLAPLYDLLATGAYPDLTPKLAMKIGKRATLAELDAEGWAAFAAETGVGLPLIRRRVAETSKGVIARTREVTAELVRERAERCALTVAEAGRPATKVRDGGSFKGNHGR